LGLPAKDDVREICRHTLTSGEDSMQLASDFSKFELEDMLRKQVISKNDFEALAEDLRCSENEQWRDLCRRHAIQSDFDMCELEGMWRKRVISESDFALAEDLKRSENQQWHDQCQLNAVQE
jgi:hypothetical protein